MMAYVFGKPVVVTRVGSLPEYVQDGVTGLLVPPADVEQLTEAIVRLLTDEGLRDGWAKTPRFRRRRGEKPALIGRWKFLRKRSPAARMSEKVN